MIFDLPTALEFGGRSWDIATDYRDILRIIEAFEDPDLTDADKAMVCLYNLYVDLEDMPEDLLQEALNAAIAFIDNGQGDDEHGPRMMDWTQDAPLIFPAVNRVAGFEVRSVDYMHWWTFLGLFMEIHDSVYSTVLSLRGKKARGKKLEKDEREFWRHNRRICELKPRYTQEEIAEKERLKQIIGG